MCLVARDERKVLQACEKKVRIGRYLRHYYKKISFCVLQYVNDDAYLSTAMGCIAASLYGIVRVL